jgi:hypothetical protein
VNEQKSTAKPAKKANSGADAKRGRNGARIIAWMPCWKPLLDSRPP